MTNTLLREKRTATGVPRPGKATAPKTEVREERAEMYEAAVGFRLPARSGRRRDNGHRDVVCGSLDHAKNNEPGHRVARRGLGEKETVKGTRGQREERGPAKPAWAPARRRSTRAHPRPPGDQSCPERIDALRTPLTK